MKKPPLPLLETDDKARAFVDHEDLSRFDLSGGEMVRYEFQTKNGHHPARN